MKKSFISKRAIIFIIQFIFFLALFGGIASLLFIINIEYIYLFLFIAYFVNTFFVFFIGLQRRNFEAKLGWLYIIILFPIIGHALFFGFGWISRNKNEIKIKDDAKFKIQTYQKDGYLHSEDCYSEALNAISKINDTTSMNSDYEFITDGYRFYQKLFKDIKKAKKSIYIISYIIKNSEISTELLHLLRQKHFEGVEIKWLVDYFGAYYSQKKEIKKLQKLGIKISYIGKIYYPFINASSFNRNHQKFLIIDSEVVFSGGNNISDEYASMSKKYGHWIDVNYKITGEYVNVYNLHFLKLWKIFSNEDLDIKQHLLNFQHTGHQHKNHSVLVSESPSFPHSQSEFTWIKLLSQAKRSIKIASPYFSASDALYREIIVALRSGVEVIVYFPGLPDKKIVHQIGIWQLKKLMQHGLKVQIYQGHFLHSKIGVIDDQIAWAGTNNFDSRSMNSQYETMDIIYGRDVMQIVNIFKEYDRFCIDLQSHPTLNKEYNFFENFFFSWLKHLI
ncbi:cardiolipin synthase [Mycoplasmopsis mustelae]|uniref:Cardiolipin synthase n=1 Tax=Mycoplasmopsis mustelae TaxID=171289 RepID=A0A4R7UC19_9BACT|nr:phospholipase D-like domain-containing protein [Mycoplasmopsis mustelae]TDV23052.1 cardiolipin synthase [Mycoplasmopsis mustelae]